METMQLSVSENLQVVVMPDKEHEFLMTTQQVAIGYGVSIKTIRKHLTEHADELIENKHFLKGATNSSHLAKNAQPNQIYWTKRGIVRLGFFIKSEKAKLFRDWAEDLVIFVSESKPNGYTDQLLKVVETISKGMDSLANTTSALVRRMDMLEKQMTEERTATISSGKQSRREKSFLETERERYLNQLTYFETYIKPGDIIRLASSYKLSPNTVAQVKMGYKRSQKIETLLMLLCESNRYALEHGENQARP